MAAKRAEILLLTALGPDRKGLMASLTKRLARYELDVLDIGQSTIHRQLSLSLLVRSPDRTQSALALRAFMLWGETRGLTLRFHPVGPSAYERWVQRQGRGRYIITLMSPVISASQLSVATSTCTAHGMTIDNITRLSGRRSLRVQSDEPLVPACVELSVRGLTDRERFHSDLLVRASEHKMDISVQQDDIFRRNRRLMVLDMDSTLIATEVIDELAREAGVGTEVAAITARAMAGELDFATSLRKRVKLLTGLEASAMNRVAERLPLTEGADHLLATLRRLGLQTAIISGGFRFFGDRIAARLGIDHVYANDLTITDGTLTGSLQNRVITAEYKAKILEQLAKKLKLHLNQVIAVGDGANDLKMLSRAGLGIAFRAKPLVRQSAKSAILNSGIDSILYLMGLRASDQFVYEENEGVEA